MTEKEALELVAAIVEDSIESETCIAEESAAAEALAILREMISRRERRKTWLTMNW